MTRQPFAWHALAVAAGLGTVGVGVGTASAQSFVPSGAESTDATMDFSAQPLRTGTKIASTVLSPVVTPALRKALLADLADLAAAAEQRAAR